jgi:hypothetical protein
VLTALVQMFGVKLVELAPTHVMSQRMAEAASAAADPLSSLIQYGVLGIVVIGFITGWIVPGPQAKQLIEENKRLTALIENKLLPMSEQYAVALDRSAVVMDKATTALEKAIESQRHLVDHDRQSGR